MQLVTVTSRGYVPGTAVMLHSFLRCNRWFQGTIRVLHNDLDDGAIAQLSCLWPRMQFRDANTGLTETVAALCSERDHLASRARRFMSLDCFVPGGAETILFCDSDLLFLQDISDFIAIDAPLVACGDRAEIEGKSRDPVTLREGISDAGNRAFHSFNAGLMLIHPELRTGANWQAICDNLKPSAWDTVQSSHTDQAIVNRVFGTEVTIADPAFNFLVGHAARLRAVADLRLTQARVLHFNNRTKPWIFDHHADAARSDASTIKAFEHWFSAYQRYLAQWHFSAS